jgi:hypothetical protein
VNEAEYLVKTIKQQLLEIALSVEVGILYAEKVLVTSGNKELAIELLENAREMLTLLENACKE